MQITELAFPACKQGRKKEPTDLSTEDLKPRLTGGKLVGAWGFEAESDSVQKLLDLSGKSGALGIYFSGFVCSAWHLRSLQIYA